MRFLSFHCDYFRYKATKRSRSKIFEELTEENRENGFENVIALYISVEKRDEGSTEFIPNAIKEIEKIATQLKVSNIILLSFAHLFGELSNPEFGLKALKNLEKKLVENGFNVLRPPFGWFNELELKAKGHPLSRISRKIE
jgi:threonyl-tRNA synthetase